MTRIAVAIQSLWACGTVTFGMNFMKRRFLILPLAALVLTALLAAGCSSSKKSSSSTPATTGSSSTGPLKVDIKNFTFTPENLKVKVGQSVTFTNSDDTTHTATAKDGSFDTGALAQGATKTETFSKAGTYHYICSIHNSMTGTITVTS